MMNYNTLFLKKKFNHLIVCLKVQNCALVITLKEPFLKHKKNPNQGNKTLYEPEHICV